MKSDLSYIECAGVRVPRDWSIEQLREALAKRKIRFQNEAELMEVFGDAITLKQSLEANVDLLKAKVERLTRLEQERQKGVLCPRCGIGWTQPAEAKTPQNKVGANNKTPKGAK